MGADPPLDDARHVLAGSSAPRPSVHQAGPVQCPIRGRFRKVTDLDPALDLLEGHGYLAPAPIAERRGAGRAPSPAWLVHPEINRPAGTVPPISAGRAS